MQRVSATGEKADAINMYIEFFGSDDENDIAII